MALREYFHDFLIRFAKRFFFRYPIKTLQRAVFPYRDEPFLHIYEAAVHKYSSIHATGKSFFSEIDAMTFAVGEAVERFSYYEFFPKEYIDVPYKDVKSKNSLDIFSLAGFSLEQKQTDSRLQFDENTQFRFIEGKDLMTGGAAYIPLQLASPKHFRRATGGGGESAVEIVTPHEPLLRMPLATGVAAGKSEDPVVCNGILECIERDAFMITYLNTISPPQIDIQSLDIYIRGQRIGDFFSFFGLEVHLVKLLTDFPVSAIAAVIVDRSGRGPALSIGAAAHLDMRAACSKALTEALTSRLFTRFNGLHRMEIPKEPPTGSKGRKIFWGKLENLEKIGFLINGPVEDTPPRSGLEKQRNSYRAQRCILLDALKERHCSAYYIDMTLKRASIHQLRVGEVIIPELQPMHFDERYPYLGGERLRSVPQTLGYTVSGRMNPIPHPFH